MISASASSIWTCCLNAAETRVLLWVLNMIMIQISIPWITERCLGSLFKDDWLGLRNYWIWFWIINICFPPLNLEAGCKHFVIIDSIWFMVTCTLWVSLNCQFGSQDSKGEATWKSISINKITQYQFII